MSKTRVVSSYTRVKRTASILLTPSKRPHTIMEPEESKALLHKDILAWTLTAEATASCFVRDVLEATGSEGTQDFYWLGRVPCRNVRLVGLIVGVGIYENRIIYTVDDGSAVIDCSHRQAKLPQKVKDEASSSKLPSPPPPVKPVAYVGDFARVVGKIVPKYEERHIVVDHIEMCTSANEELNHRQLVMKLHKIHYSLPEPFVIPQSKIPCTPARGIGSRQQITPTTVHSSPSPSLASSPQKSDCMQPSPHKLRHPSRLHSAELIPNTFRIYVKYFMDNDPRCVPMEDLDLGNGSVVHEPPSPTKFMPAFSGDVTPRPSQRREFSKYTPRPRIDPISYGITNSTTIAPKEQNEIDGTKGYTLSYLRRVPELSLLARRVLKQEARMAKKKLKDMVAAGKSKPTSNTAQKTKLQGNEEKRLFRRAINELYNEGSIIIWDGPVRTCAKITDTSQLWKVNVSSASVSYDMTTSSSIFGQSKTAMKIDLDDDAELSDPQPNEEAYIPLKTAYLADFLEETLPKLKAAQDSASKFRKPYTGVTSEALLNYLRRDDRWQFIRLDSVNEALAFLKEEGRIWCPRDGQWDITY